MDMFLPFETRFEGSWWNRTVQVDGRYSQKEVDHGMALAAAERYVRSVATGNLTLIRQFLETSMRKTDRPILYIRTFHDMLNALGKNEFDKKLCKVLRLQKIESLRSIFGYGFGGSHHRKSEGENNRCKEAIEIAIKVMLGFTRKRHLLVPEWADDGLLWNAPEQKGLQGPPVPKIILG